nr:hypothetical protein [Tanacetum cinerariifolium]
MHLRSTLQSTLYALNSSRLLPRRDLKFEDEGGVDYLANKVIFKQLTLMGVLNLEITKTAQAKEISSLKKRVKGLEKKKRSGTYGLKRLYKVGLAARVESSAEEQSLGEERFNDQEMFDTYVLNDEEVVVEDINAASIATDVTVAATTTISIDDITLAQALVEIKTSKPKERSIIMQEPIETPTTTTIPISSKSSRQRKRLAEEKAQLIEDENFAWDNVKAIMDADYELAV